MSSQGAKRLYTEPDAQGKRCTCEPTGECRVAMSGPTCFNPDCPPCQTPELELDPDCPIHRHRTPFDGPDCKVEPTPRCPECDREQIRHRAEAAEAERDDARELNARLVSREAEQRLVARQERDRAEHLDREAWQARKDRRAAEAHATRLEAELERLRAQPDGAYERHMRECAEGQALLNQDRADREAASRARLKAAIRETRDWAMQEAGRLSKAGYGRVGMGYDDVADKLTLILNRAVAASGEEERG